MAGARNFGVREARTVLVLAVLIALPSFAVAAASQSVAADLAVDAVPRLDGTLRATARDATLVVVPPAEGPVLFGDVLRGSLRLVHSERNVLDNPLGGDVYQQPTYGSDTVDLAGARITVRDPGADFLLLLVPLEGGQLALDLQQARCALPAESSAQTFSIGPGDTQPYYYTRNVPADSFRLDCDSSRVSGLLTDGVVQVPINGALLDVDGPDGTTTYELGEHIERTPGPAGQAGYIERRTFAVLDLEAPALTVGDGASIDFHSQAPTLALDGRLVLERATGVVRSGDRTLRAEDARVELEGQFQVQATRQPGEATLLDREEGRSAFHVEGSASSVLVGGRALATPLEEQAAVPALTVAALALAWLTGLGPKALALAAAPLYATATPQSVLANERRRAIYQAVLRQPGIHMRELHRATGMRWGSLQYHTALLLGTGLLVASRAGRRTVLACDVHHLTPEQIRALHLLRSPRAQGVARAVARSAAITQRDIAESTGVSFRLVSRYLRMMTDLGLVEQIGEGRPKRYAATPRLGDLLPHAALRGENPPSEAAAPPAPPALPPAV